MKRGILLLLLLSSVFVKAQSLKEALYGGKLKNDAGTVIRKGDDLRTKMDTVKKIAPDSTKALAAATVFDSAAKGLALKTDSSSLAATATNEAGNAGAENLPASADSSAAVASAVAPKDNEAVLKGFMDSLVSTLKTDVLPSKRVKEGAYLVLISYAIETDGQLSFNDVFVAPENDFLKDQINQRLGIDVPHLQPVLSSSGKARKVNKKYKFNLVKQ